MYTGQDILLQAVKRTFSKIEILSKDLTVVDMIEGKVIDGSINVDGSSDVRRSLSLTLILDDNTIPKLGSAVFVDKYIKVYIGIERLIDKEICWYNMGVFIPTTPQITYNESTNQVVITGSDRMCELNGVMNGTLDASSVTIEKTKGTNIRQVMVDTLEQLTPISQYQIDNIGSEYKTQISNYTGSAYTDLPYEITDVNTVYDILYKCSTLYPNWEIYFDGDGTFQCHMIPYGENEPNDFEDELIQKLVMSEDITEEYSNIANKISVYGSTLTDNILFTTQNNNDIDDSSDQAVNKNNVTYSIDGNNINYRLVFRKPDFITPYESSDILSGNGCVAATIPTGSSTTNLDNTTTVYAITGTYIFSNEALAGYNASTNPTGCSPMNYGQYAVYNKYVHKDCITLSNGQVQEYDQTINNNYVSIFNVAIDKDYVYKNVTVVKNDTNYVITNNDDSSTLTDCTPIWIPALNKFFAVKNEILCDDYYYWSVGKMCFNNNAILNTSTSIISYFDGVVYKDGKRQSDYTRIYKSGGTPLYLKKEYICYSDDPCCEINLDYYIPKIYIDGENLTTKYFMTFKDSFNITADSNGVPTNRSEYTNPRIQNDLTYVFEYKEMKTKDANEEVVCSWSEFLYMLQLAYVSYYDEFVSANNLSSLQDLITQVNTIINNNSGDSISTKFQQWQNIATAIGCESDGFLWFLGEINVHATYRVTDTRNPYCIQNIGEKLLKCQGDEYDNITSYELAMQRAKWEAYKSTILNKTLTLQTTLIPWIDINQKFNYTTASTKENNDYLVKSISFDFKNWTCTITAAQYYPYYATL